jgi:hypothetical protein
MMDDMTVKRQWSGVFEYESAGCTEILMLSLRSQAHRRAICDDNFFVKDLWYSQVTHAKR